MSDGGKGSAPRPFSVDRETYESNWDRIFAKKENDMAKDESLKIVCNKFLLAMLGSEELAKTWWSSYNNYFAMTPNEQWKINSKLVYNYLVGSANDYS